MISMISMISMLSLLWIFLQISPGYHEQLAFPERILTIVAFPQPWTLLSLHDKSTSANTLQDLDLSVLSEQFLYLKSTENPNDDTKTTVFDPIVFCQSRSKMIQVGPWQILGDCKVIGILKVHRSTETLWVSTGFYGLQVWTECFWWSCSKISSFSRQTNLTLLILSIIKRLNIIEPRSFMIILSAQPKNGTIPADLGIRHAVFLSFCLHKKTRCQFLYVKSMAIECLPFHAFSQIFGNIHTQFTPATRAWQKPWVAPW